MKTKYLGVILAGIVACGLSACTGYTQVKDADGTTVTRGHVAPGTKVTTAAGTCIDSTGSGTCEQSPQ